METVLTVLGFAVLPAIALYGYIDRYLLRRRSLRAGLAAFEAQYRPSGCTVDVASCYPLSEHMVKELAASRGLRYTGRAPGRRRLGPMGFVPADRTG